MINNTKQSISSYCKNIRINTGLSVRAFSIERGVSHTHIGKIEKGFHDNPSLTVLSKIIKIYDLTESDIEKLDISIERKEAGKLITSNTLFPNKFKYNINLNKQINNIIERSKLLTGYDFFTISNNKIKTDRILVLNYDKKAQHIKYIYDAKGKAPNGNDCFLNILYSLQDNQVKDEDYILYIGQTVKMVEASIEFGMAFDEDISNNVELIFAISSHRGYELGQKMGIDNSYLSNKKDKPKIIRRLIYFNNKGLK